MSSAPEQKHPEIGCIGLAIAGLSIPLCIVARQIEVTILVGVVGAMILIYALMTGNVKFLGGP